MIFTHYDKFLEQIKNEETVQKLTQRFGKKNFINFCKKRGRYDRFEQKWKFFNGWEIEYLIHVFHFLIPCEINKNTQHFIEQKGIKRRRCFFHFIDFENIENYQQEFKKLMEDIEGGINVTHAESFGLL